jgi:hypothetical protein
MIKGIYFAARCKYKAAKWNLRTLISVAARQRYLAQLCTYLAAFCRLICCIRCLAKGRELSKN